MNFEGLVESRELYLIARPGMWDVIVERARAEGYEVEEFDLPRWAGNRLAEWADRHGRVAVTERREVMR